MPKIYKSGKEFKGNKNSGRKPFGIEVAKKLDTDLANALTNEELVELKKTPIEQRNYQKVKDIAVAIAVKGMAEKVDLTTKGKSLNYEDDQRKKIAERIISRGKSDTGGSGEELPN